MTTLTPTEYFLSVVEDFLMSARRKLKQLDFWPELSNTSMAFYAGAASIAASTPARSPLGEDSRGSSRAGVPLGIYGENAVTSTPNRSKENLDRLAWFSHPSRAQLLAEPAWNTVFEQIVLACEDSRK